MAITAAGLENLSALLAVVAGLLASAEAASEQTSVKVSAGLQAGMMPALLVGVQSGINACPHTISQTEAQILACIRRGETNGQIARRLGLSERSVKRRIQKLYCKLGVRCRSEASAHLCTEAPVG